MPIVTQRAESPGHQYWRFHSDSEPAFESKLFDTEWLQSSGLIQGSALAGRGNTLFLTFGDVNLVLRTYRRGGLVARISKRRYIWTGLERTRAMREFNLLSRLEQMDLPISRSFACEVVKHGFSYSAALITHRVPGSTLAELLNEPGLPLPEQHWRNIGTCIKRFHLAGVWHADLNAHNILIDADGEVVLIDFDKARLRNPLQTSWQQSNLQRLHRSMQKVCSAASIEGLQAGWNLLQAGYSVMTPNASR